MLIGIGVIAIGAMAALALLFGVAAHQCPDSPDGAHEHVLESDDTDEGRTVRMVCLYCRTQTPGITTPWIRARRSVRIDGGR